MNNELIHVHVLFWRFCWIYHISISYNFAVILIGYEHDRTLNYQGNDSIYASYCKHYLKPLTFLYKYFIPSKYMKLETALQDELYEL